MWDVQQEAVAVCSDLARPGISLGRLAKQTLAVARNTACSVRFLMHGRGLGDDAPMYVFDGDEQTRRWELEENASFIIKPVVDRDGHASVIWGDSVTITPSGAKRLGTLAPEFITLG
jgi:Xaa-Pro dipeptidase